MAATKGDVTFEMGDSASSPEAAPGAAPGPSAQGEQLKYRRHRSMSEKAVPSWGQPDELTPLIGNGNGNGK